MSIRTRNLSRNSILYGLAVHPQSIIPVNDPDGVMTVETLTNLIANGFLLNGAQIAANSSNKNGILAVPQSISFTPSAAIAAISLYITGRDHLGAKTAERISDWNPTGATDVIWSGTVWSFIEDIVFVGARTTGAATLLVGANLASTTADVLDFQQNNSATGFLGMPIGLPFRSPDSTPITNLFARSQATLGTALTLSGIDRQAATAIIKEHGPTNTAADPVFIEFSQDAFLKV